MKKRLLSPLLFLLVLSGFAQNLNYQVHGKYANPIKGDALHSAKLISDIIPYYPSTWIERMGYISVEITSTCNGKAVVAKGANDILSDEQKNMLNTVDLGADIVVNIEYKSPNAVTDVMEISKMHYTATYVPDIEAQYSSGFEQMNNYIKENAITKIPETASKQMQSAIIKFTVNEAGEINNAQVFRTSGDVKTDKLLLEAITNMPKWKPAQNADGTKVKQEFILSVDGVRTGGC